MNTEVIPAGECQALKRALEVLRAGGLVAFPTDTVYGVGALAFVAGAVEALYVAKDRSIEKAIPVLIGDPQDIGKVAREVPALADKLAARFWPGPLTLVVPKQPALPAAVSATATVGVREPDHPVARALLNLAGPLAVTSANLSGGSSPTTAAQVLAQLGGRITLILDGGPTPGGMPSTVVDCMGAEPRILREGALSKAEILTFLGLNL
ncbi:MAG: L-threonylcarbamoyladenylate synthase [Anaerolineales bacterium]|jgi:L-threonylcarbamoyladenylate synthase